MRPPFESFKNPICKGSIVLNTACGNCERCAWEEQELASLRVAADRPRERAYDHYILSVLHEDTSTIPVPRTEFWPFGMSPVRSAGASPAEPQLTITLIVDLLHRVHLSCSGKDSNFEAIAKAAGDVFAMDLREVLRRCVPTPAVRA